MDLEKLNEEYIFQYLPPNDYTILSLTSKKSPIIDCFPFLSIKEGLKVAKNNNSRIDYNLSDIENGTKEVALYLRTLI